jgi:hypothetical protein
MSEIQTPLTRVPSGENYTNTTDDDVWVITADNTHMDILRYVIDDLGWSEAVLHLESLKL